MVNFADVPRPRWNRCLGLCLVFIILLGYFTGPLQYLHVRPSYMEIAQDLEAKALSRFDDLLASDKIFYEETQSELFVDNGFKFEFRITSVFKRKPILRATDPGRSTAGGPFISPDPEEVITELGSSHRLLINKFCVYRPMLVIPTTKYVPQADDLDISDISAAWKVLKAFDTPSVVIYNCGTNAGSSQGHKHLQLFPLPEHQLWPAEATSPTGVATSLKYVPFKHYVLRLPLDADVEHVYTAYRRLLALCQAALISSGSDSRDYNVALTPDWIAVIPRRTAGPQGPFGANAAGMLGMVTVPDQREREWWAELGYTEYLKTLGIPI